MNYSADGTWKNSLIQEVSAEVARLATDPALPTPSGERFCTCVRCIVRESVNLAMPMILQGAMDGLAEIRRRG